MNPAPPVIKIFLTSGLMYSTLSPISSKSKGDIRAKISFGFSEAKSNFSWPAPFAYWLISYDDGENDDKE